MIYDGSATSWREGLVLLCGALAKKLGPGDRSPLYQIHWDVHDENDDFPDALIMSNGELGNLKDVVYRRTDEEVENR